MNAKQKTILKLAQDAVSLLEKPKTAETYMRGAGKAPKPFAPTHPENSAKDGEEMGNTQHREVGFIGKDGDDMDPKDEAKAGMIQTASGLLAHHGKNQMAADCYAQAHKHYGNAYDCMMAGDEAGCGEHMESARKVHAQADGMGMDADGPAHDPKNGQFTSGEHKQMAAKHREASDYHSEQRVAHRNKQKQATLGSPEHAHHTEQHELHSKADELHSKAAAAHGKAAHEVGPLNDRMGGHYSKTAAAATKKAIKHSLKTVPA